MFNAVNDIHVHFKPRCKGGSGGGGGGAVQVLIEGKT